MDLDALARATSTGDPRAMEDLLAACAPLALRTCSRILPCRQDAEDAAQDALLIVATRLSSWSGRGPFGAWLRAVTANSARGTYRQLQLRAVEAGAVHRLDLAADPRTTSVIAGTRLDLLDAIEALERHNPEHAQAVVLRDLGDLTYQDIADALSVPLGTAKSWVHDGRQHLRRRLHH